MLLEIAISMADVPGFLRTLLGLPGAAAWQRREGGFLRQMRENPPIENYINDRFAIERAMARVVRYRKNTGRIPGVTDDPDTDAIGRLYELAGMVARVHPELSPAAQKILAGKITGALNDNVGLASLAFEMKTACHFMSHGFDVEFHDLENGGGHDFIARRSNAEVDVECKTIGGDLGRKIHLVRQYQLWQKIHPSMVGALSAGKGRLVVATLPDRLPSDEPSMRSIASAIESALSGATGASGNASMCAVETHVFDLAASPFFVATPDQIGEDDIVEFCRREFGQAVRHTVMVFRPRESVALVALRSAKSDKFLEGVYRQLKEGARQLSRTRPGVLCVQFLTLTGAQLRDVADTPSQTGQPSGLQAMTAKFFDSPGRDHVHSVAYTAAGTFVRRSYRADDRVVKDIGENAPAYFFTNKRHPNADDPNYGLFLKTPPRMS